jgi:hypothetical protein
MAWLYCVVALNGSKKKNPYGQSYEQTGVLNI